MDTQHVRVKLANPLIGVHMAPAAPTAPSLAEVPAKASQSTAAPSPKQPAIPAAVHNDFAELGRLAKEMRARERLAAVDVAQLSVELGVSIAERLLEEGIRTNRQRLERLVLRVLEQKPATRSVTVRGHADDLALLRTQLAAHPDHAAYQDLVKFRQEEKHARGRFTIEADDWFAEWDTPRCLAELRATLLEETFADP